MSSAFFRRPVWPCISRAGLSIAALFILFASLVLGWSANAADEPRTALVIGNGAYSYGSLANAVTDATDMADALRDVGFEVTLLTDADQRAMDKALTGFSDALSAKGGVGLLYYSGHGVQVDNENYALPIGDELKREDDVKYEAVNIAQVITNLSGAGNSLNIVIIDACRNNPLQSSGRSATRGLARADGGPGLFVSFSTSPGAVALDGDGRNSPFTSHLIRAIRMPGLSLEEAFKETLKGTYTETEGEQLPWISSSFFGDFVFNGSGAEIAPDPPVSVARNMPEEEVTVAARAAGFLPLAGIYRASGTNPDGSRYRGMTSVSISGGVYRLTWWIGNDVFHGTGRLGGRMLIVDWNSTAPVIYTLKGNGVLDGEWADGTATETLEPFALAAYGTTPRIAGDYRVSGHNPDGSGYSGTLKITPASGGYHVRWDVAGQVYDGFGALEGNLLPVEWGPDTPVVYALAADGSLVGLWGGGAGDEALIPVR
jgi:hypothetical protein